MRFNADMGYWKTNLNMEYKGGKCEGTKAVVEAVWGDKCVGLTCTVWR